MAAKKRAPQSTPWRAVTWERTYRGEAIWVEEVYALGPKFEWSAVERGGRARTREEAQRFAMRAVDSHAKTKTLVDASQWWDDRHSLLGVER